VNSSVQSKILAGACLVLPFGIFYWLVPLFSPLTIGNDYPRFSIEQQQALMYSMLHGVFPLYVPGFLMGQSAAALTLGQLFHPLPHVASLFPSYWQGDALLINTQLRLISLGYVHVLLFHVLRKLGLKTLLAFVLSFITIYNLRMLDMFRYGASLENYTGYVILCSCIILNALELRYRYVVGIVIGAWLLTVGGHPQIAYIGFLGAAIVAMLAPGVIVDGRLGVVFGRRRLLRYWSWVLLAVLAGVVLAAPYVAGFYFDFLSYHDLRANKPYSWAIGYQDSWGGLLRSFYSPLRSDVHGAFGGSAIIMLTLMFPVAILMYKKYFPTAWLAFAAAFLAFLIASGDATPVHYWVWEYMPAASTFRVPGRFSLMIVFPLLFVLVWITSYATREADGGGQSIVPLLASNLTVLALLACGLYIILNQSVDPMLPASSWFVPEHINDVKAEDFKNGYYLGIAVLLVLAVYLELSARGIKALAIPVGLILVALVALETTNTLRYGTWVAKSKEQRTADQIAALIQKSYTVPADSGYGMTSALIHKQVEWSIVEPKIARFYRKVSAFEKERDAQRYLLTERKPDEAVVLGASSLSMRPQSSDQMQTEEVRLTAFRYNQLDFLVSSESGGLLSTNLPFRENWHVLLNGVPTEAVLANGYETAVFVPAGTHELAFRYESPAVKVGMLLACILLALLFLSAAWRASTTTFRASYLVLSIFPVVFFYLWYTSLYDGEQLDIDYYWSSEQFPSSENLSYARKASASSQLSHFLYPGLAVDGDFNGRPFRSGYSVEPTWTVDLGGLRAIESIVVHQPMARSLPITVLLSTDGGEFTPAATITSAQETVEVNFDTTFAAQYVSLRSNGKTVLGFAEVEVMGRPEHVTGNEKAPGNLAEH
jgi:hypothetical protein